MSSVDQQMEASYGAVAPPISRAYVGQVTPTTAGAVATATNASVGPVNPSGGERRIVVGVSWEDDNTNRSPASATIGGVTAQIDVISNSAATNDRATAILSALLPAGTTATVAVTFSPSLPSLITFNIWQVLDETSPTPVVATDQSLTGNALSAAVTLSAPGVVIAASHIRDATSATWSVLTEDYDPAGGKSGASGEFTAGSVTATVTGNISNTPSNLAVAGWV